MRGVNKVMLLGNVGRKPEIRIFDNGNHQARFSLATNERSRTKGDVTTWHNIVAWGSLAETVARYVQKGAPLYVEGKIRRREYDNDGERREWVEIVASDIIMVGKRPETPFDASNEVEKQAQQEPEGEWAEGELPF